ncbi:Mur ligase domain-containing protein [Candidatus Kuenenia stuttgartensis]|uniref:Mur ligase domain-containing protein n=1 Tax=Kuenenia stuttgartiensis TaxID=174633 RepID=UPI001469D737|nr:Mur ligase domain-containing protein [Candidatus Kuenenia stuttgartiensis]
MKHPLKKNPIENPCYYHLVGIGGIGMSAIAQVLKEMGHHVSGSDRNLIIKLQVIYFSKLSLRHQPGPPGCFRH